MTRMKRLADSPWSPALWMPLLAVLGAALLGPAAAAAGVEEARPPQAGPEGAAAPPQEAPKQDAPPAGGGLPAGVLARLNGRDIRVDEYASYLLASLGKSRLDEYIDRLLVEEEAKRLDIVVSQEAVEASVQERIDRIVKSVYKGQEEVYLANLARRRTSLDEEKAKLRQERYYDLLRDQIILKTRQVTEADIQREFEKLYGEGGVRTTLRHILIAARPAGAAGPPARAGDDEGAAAKAGGLRTRAEARERAEMVLKELQAGGDFAQAVKQYSDDALTKRNDGRIPVYRKEYLGEEFHRAVTQLAPESPLSGIVESPRGFHIIQLVEKKVTRLEDVKAELEKAVKEEPPSAKERLDLVARLREGAKIEGL
jgi:parvulin-like peptidyl-prolyl isomerase